MKHLIALTLAASVLAGCQTTGSAPAPSPAPDSGIATVQATVSGLCGFVPDPGVINKLVNFFGLDNAGILTMAQQICAAVSAPQMLGRRGSTPMLHGVRITGRFVR